MSITDSLTRTFNRHKLDQVLVREISQSNRYKSQLSIIMLDIDYFKQINDQFGHIVGDNVLKSFAKLINGNLRDNDVLGRWGGEEFLIICPGIGTSSAQSLAEKLRVIIEKTDFAPASGLTASFGVTEYLENDQKDVIVSRADNALYSAKDSGRNKVSVG